MSEPMEAAKSNILKAMETQLDEGVKERLGNAAKIISQNRNKIWLRTKTGKPIAEKALSVTEELLTLTEGSPSADQLNAAVLQVESVAKEIAEESRRRSMVVT